jgi:prevent-host-death family protein
MNEPDPPQALPYVDSIGSRYLRENIGPVLDYVQKHGKPVVVTRHGRPSVAIVPADWIETGDTPADTHLRALPARIGPE